MMAGLVLGVESVPDGLATGVLAGVNPVAGLYSYLYGTIGAALFTSTAFMAVQGTGAMSIIIADVELGNRDDPARALFTLSIVTGAVMILAGLLRLGSFLRFVSNSVMTGFITAVGVNIVLGQLDDFTGYDSSGSNRLARALDLLLNFWEIHLPTITVGAVTVVLIVVLERTRLGSLGMVVAIIGGSALAMLFNTFTDGMPLVRDIANVPTGLPRPMLPVLRDVPFLLLPAASLAFVGLVQGAGVASGFPNVDGTASHRSQDFVAQGAGNLASGLFQGIPVGGSMSGTSIVASAGAKTRAALFYAGLTMAVVIVLFGAVVELFAIPSIAGLLIVVGVATIKPKRVMAVARTGPVPLTVMTITFILTVIIPLQFAVLVGVGISTIMFVIQQSSRLVTKRMIFHDDGSIEEVDPPEVLAAGEVVVLNPYGAIFFATAPVLLSQMPTVVPESRNSVVILRARGASDAGATLIDVLAKYAASLAEVDSRLIVVTDNQAIVRQLGATGVTERIGPESVYLGTSFFGATVRRAHDDAVAWVEAQRVAGEEGAS